MKDLKRYSIDADDIDHDIEITVRDPYCNEQKILFKAGSNGWFWYIGTGGKCYAVYSDGRMFQQRCGFYDKGPEETKL